MTTPTPRIHVDTENAHENNIDIKKIAIVKWNALDSDRFGYTL